MRKTRAGFGVAAVLLVWCGAMLLSSPSSANSGIQKSAKAAGIAADNCMYCHVEKMPKKGAVTENDRGKWLVAEKAKRNATTVDGAWLKDYPGDKK
jgi:hypothetical protein